MNEQPLKKKDVLYYARIIPTVGIFEVCQLIIRTVKEDCFVGCDKVDKHSYLFPYSCLNKTVFRNRQDALNTVLAAEKTSKRKLSNGTYYEEY